MNDVKKEVKKEVKIPKQFNQEFVDKLEKHNTDSIAQGLIDDSELPKALNIMLEGKIFWMLKRESIFTTKYGFGRFFDMELLDGMKVSVCNFSRKKETLIDFEMYNGDEHVGRNVRISAEYMEKKGKREAGWKGVSWNGEYTKPYIVDGEEKKPAVPSITINGYANVTDLDDLLPDTFEKPVENIDAELEDKSTDIPF